MALFEQFGSAEATPAAVRAMLERKEKLFGFGHPLYRAYDPRAVILKQFSEELSKTAASPNWFAITDAAERTVFEEKGLYPNVDLYSASVYRYLGIPTRSLHTALRGEPRRRPGRARARAARGQQDHPPVGDLRRRAAPRSSGDAVTLAEAAAQADALAEEGKERELSQLRAQWDEELEAAARGADFRERAVAYRAIGQFRFRTKKELLRRGLEDDSPAVRGSALLSLERLSRDHPGVVNDVRPLLHELVTHDGNEAVRRLAVVALKNGSPRPDTIQILASLGDDDEQPRELREAATKVAQAASPQDAK